MGAWQREHLSLITAASPGVRRNSLATLARQKGSRVEFAIIVEDQSAAMETSCPAAEVSPS
jgi:hypothetical protein